MRVGLYENQTRSAIASTRQIAKRQQAAKMRIRKIVVCCKKTDKQKSLYQQQNKLRSLTDIIVNAEYLPRMCHPSKQQALYRLKWGPFISLIVQFCAGDTSRLYRTVLG